MTKHIRIVDILCKSCKELLFEDMLIDLRDPPQSDRCPHCGQDDCHLIRSGIEKILASGQAPAVPRDSFIDGTNRWPLEKIKAKLGVDKAQADCNNDFDTSKQIDTEIKKLDSGKYKKRIKE